MSRYAVFLLLALVVVSLVSGCDAGKDQGTVVKYDPKQTPAPVDQKQIDAIKNNPNIPESQKQAILGRMGGAQGKAR